MVFGRPSAMSRVPPGTEIGKSVVLAEHLLSMALMSWSRRERGPTLRSACSAEYSTRVWNQGMTSARRIGAPDAKNRGVLLDAAEQLMLEEGYAAVTSRRVAEKAALKPQLVHYYFRTMDELFLAAFRRRAEEGLEVQAQVLQARATAVGAVAVQHRSGGHRDHDGIHRSGQPPQSAEGRDRVLRGAFSRRATQSADDDSPCATASTRRSSPRWCGRC